MLLEVDFLLVDKAKVTAIEVKSSSIDNHKSIEEFAKKYSGVKSRHILFSQKDISHKEMLEFKSLYLTPISIEETGKSQYFGLESGVIIETADGSRSVGTGWLSLL